jgi:protein-disulfide isomerase
VVAKIGERAITLEEVDARIKRELYEARDGALDQLITDAVVEEAAKKANLPAEEFLRKEVSARVPEVSEKEARDFYDANKDRLPERFQGKSFAELKPMIIDGLTGKKREEAVGAFVEELKTKASVKILMEAPKIEVAATGPSRGPDKAKVTIVEFSDFQCPYCKRGREVMDEVVKAYPNDVRVVFRDFPLGFHPYAQKAAEAGQCAGEQGKFWPMHDWMFDHQDQLAVEDLVGAAKSLGLDAKKFEACVTSGKQADAVRANQKAGESAGVKGTPAYFVNGVFISGAMPFEKFKATIDHELSR